MNKPYFVRAEWDAEAAVWVATSDDVPGLITEAETIEALDAKLKGMVPELLEANGCMPADSQVTVELLARRFSMCTGLCFTQKFERVFSLSKNQTLYQLLTPG